MSVDSPKQKWLSALRNGEYKQGNGSLQKVIVNVSGSIEEGVTCEVIDKSFCCLGVLHNEIGGEWVSTESEVEYKLLDGVFDEDIPFGEEEVSISAMDGDQEFISQDLLPQSVQSILASANDKGFTFEEIAWWIEAHLNDDLSTDLSQDDLVKWEENILAVGMNNSKGFLRTVKDTKFIL